MTPQWSGVITRIAYYSKDRDTDHVDVRLTEDCGMYRVGDVIPTYRCDVLETAEQECQEESWRRNGP